MGTQIFFRIKGNYDYHNFQTDQVTRDIVADINANALHVTPLVVCNESKHRKFNYLCALRVRYGHIYKLYAVKSFVSKRAIGEIAIFLEDQQQFDLAYTTKYDFLGSPIKLYNRYCLERLLIVGIDWRKIYNGDVPINPNDNDLLQLKYLKNFQ